jgi:RNA polymerase sigma factor (sigma-70 family)
MATTPLETALDKLRSTWLRHDESGLTDAELLDCFIARRDEAAFEALVRRHGPMVLSVCRRVLQNDADAEDAFQATFLVLVKKAASIRPPSMVGNWLYGVAHTTALKARAMRTKRLVKEREATARTRPEPAADTRQQLHALLDQELKALPDKYRTAIVLCDLEGHSIRMAARQLGCPPGTVGTRLARGRRLLSQRLARHGLVLSGSVIATVIAQHAAGAGVSPLLLSSTVRAATQFAAGQAATSGLISANVLALTKGVLAAMFLTKLKISTAVLLALAVAAVAAVVATFPAKAAQLAPPPVAVRNASQDQDTPKAESRPVVVHEDSQIRTVAYSADGKILATIGLVYELVDFTDGAGNPTGSGGVIPHSTIMLWDATTGTLLRSLGEEKDTYIAAIAFSPDKKTAAVSVSRHILTKDPDDPLKFETEIRVIDATTWALKHKVKPDTFASALAFSPDGTRLAFGGRSRLTDDAAFVRLWDVNKQKLIGGTEGGGYRVHCLAFSRDGSQLATGDENGKVRLFDGRSGTPRRDFDGHGPLRSGGEQCVTGVGFSPDAKTLVSGCMDKTVKLWDLEAGKLLRDLHGNTLPIFTLAFSPDGRLFATAGAVQRQGKCESVEVLLWDTKTGKPSKAFPDQSMNVNSLAFSPDGTTLAIGVGNGLHCGPETANGRAHTPGGFKLWKLGVGR